LPLVRLESGNLSSRVYQTIREALINGHFEPGTRLKIGALAEELGTSITPVREAIFRLVSEQALVMSAATSVQVPYLSPDALREIRCIRMELEGLAAAQAALRITNGQIRELEAIQRRFVAAVRTDAKQASLHNREFALAHTEP